MRHLVALPLAVGALLVACLAPVGASVAAKPNACKVLKAAEVTRVTGFPATKATRQQQGPSDAGICGYTLTDPNSPVRTVSVFVQRSGEQRVTKIGYRTAKATFKEQLEPVSGFGKSAFYAGGGLNTLYVLEGDTLLYVQYVAFGDDDPAGIKADVEDMTKIALARV